MDKRMIIRYWAAVLSLALLTGCAVQEEPSGSLVSDFQSVHTSSEESSVAASEDNPSSVEESGEQDSEVVKPDEISGVSQDSQPEESSEASDTSDLSESDTAQTDVSSESEDNGAELPEVTSSAQTTTTSTSTTVATTAPPEPVNIVIPEVRVPLSPGTDIASNDKAVLDYSNASEGYISVRWNGTGKMVKLRLTYGDKVYDHDVSGGGTTEYFPLSCGSGVYKAQLYEQTEGNSYSKSLEIEFTAKISGETTPFLYPNKYVDFSSESAAVKKAAEICTGKTDTIEKLAAIFQWITDNVTYDKQLAATVQSGYVPDPDQVLKKKSGICYDYSSLLAAMTRSQDIPTRLVVGYAAENIYHAWNEVYTDETGWITPELLLSKHGYNIMDSTFYAGSSDKEKIAQYISDSGNYSALYYY